MRSETKRLKDKAWKLFSQYIRLKYADKNGNVACYTCGKILPWQASQCGHGISGRKNYVLFLEEVCRPQCVSCNIYHNGLYEVFITKLADEYTLEQVKRWVNESRKPLKRYKADYIQIIEELQAQLDEYAEMGRV